MRILSTIAHFILLWFLLISCTTHPKEHLNLDANWKFRHPDSTTWLSAKVPGSVHLNLLDQGLIGDPFFENNESDLQWIGESDWEFKTSFQGSSLPNHDRVELIFEGLDTYADVYLNDSLILKADNMFRTWDVDIGNLILRGDNHLYIRFFAPGRIEKDKESEVSYRLPEIRGFTRKAPYQYGWDWGPTFITSGIWRPVYICAWNSIRIQDVHPRLDYLDKDVAQYSVVMEIESTGDEDALIRTFLDEQPVSGNEKNVSLHKGLNTVKLDFSIPDPRLWWPSGLGDQPLYALEFFVKTKNGEDSKKVRIGVREIDLVIREDSIGESFYFTVNDVPVFMKGANYIPQDNFLSRVTDEQYRNTLQAAVDANMNMLRVWGGGVYEKDIFYDLCDEMGLLVWQDFMFACNMYPVDNEFLENVKNEANQQVLRLRNHPSIAIWCGNNEISEGWYNWGWQSSLGYTEEDSLEVWNGYLAIFEELLPGIIKEFDPDRSYWPSSPSTGWGHEQALYTGDMHYWGVWWGEEPFEIYEDKVGRFMTEYGFQGFPNLNTLDSCLDKQDFYLDSKNLRNHQKHPRGMELIRMYMERDFPVPVDFVEYTYISQLVQAYGIKTALEAHRRAMPWCMGTLYWQLNDCWPVISWSSVDYYHRWKALHYFTRTIFNELAISFDENDGNLEVYIISDLQVNVGSEMVLEIMDFQGKILWQKVKKLTIQKNSSNIYHSMDLNSLLEGKDRNQVMLKVVVRQEGETKAKGVHYFAKPKNLILNTPVVDVGVSSMGDGYDLILSSETLIKNVCLMIDEDGHFSDNYFDLLPGETVKVTFTYSRHVRDYMPSEDFMGLVQVLSLNDL